MTATPESPPPPSLDQIEEKILAAGGDVQAFIRQLDDSGIIDAAKQ